jgi:taurine transport system ATP-binding protein
MIKLTDMQERYPAELSGGMQQRVAIARVLANDSEIMLMDEPFGALDALTREHMQEELLAIWRQTRRTIFFITHSVEEAVYLGTRVLVMSPRPGRIVAEFDCPFSRRAVNRAACRAVKSMPEFVEFREKVLSYIWDQE